MKLQQIFEQLTYGELSQLKIGGGEDGQISQADYPRMLAHLNLGLTALHKRFPLKENRLAIGLTPGKYQYPLTSKYAISAESINLGYGALEMDGDPIMLDDAIDPETQYILDSVALPFQDDILKVEKVLTELGHELGLNDGSDRYAVSTPKANTLQVPSAIVDGLVGIPECLVTSTLTVVYRANHPLVTVGVGMFSPEDVEIDLPETHLEPLLLFIASRINNPIGMTNEFHAGNSYYAKYLAACQELETTNLNVDQGAQNTRLRSNGWV